jgi:ATP-binding cassette subfamily B (MDR/TAP) protein 1
MSRFIEVFELTGDKMRTKGNFFALMFLVLAIGTFVMYFVLGWTSNIVGQV